jgi:hypothetical protein
MKYVFLLVFLLLTPFLAYSDSNVSKQLDEWSEDSAKYKGKFTDLSDPSKRAIVTGNLDFAIQPYLRALESEFGRKQFGAESLYQIFLIYTDPYNEKRDSKLAKKYLDRLKNEYPNSDQTAKAIDLHINHNS